MQMNPELLSLHIEGQRTGTIHTIDLQINACQNDNLVCEIVWKMSVLLQYEFSKSKSCA